MTPVSRPLVPANESEASHSPFDCLTTLTYDCTPLRVDCYDLIVFVSSFVYRYYCIITMDIYDCNVVKVNKVLRRKYHR